jgi:hypothetical protein
VKITHFPLAARLSPIGEAGDRRLKGTADEIPRTQSQTESTLDAVKILIYRFSQNIHFKRLCCGLPGQCHSKILILNILYAKYCEQMS